MNFPFKLWVPGSYHNDAKQVLQAIIEEPEDDMAIETEVSAIICFPYYATPSSGEAYRDRRPTTNFELKFFVCRHVSM